MDRGDQMLAIGGLGLIVGPREEKISVNFCFELGLACGIIATVLLVSRTSVKI